VKFVSQLVTAASGKVRGLVASHNKGGAYFRGKTIPVNPRSPTQVAQRARLANLIERFRNVLTGAQRSSWDTFAKNTNVIDSLGNSMSLSGPNWYIKSNTIRSQAGLALVDGASTTYALSTLSPLTGTVVASANTMTIGWNGADEWTTNSNSAGLLIFTSRPQNQTINYFSGPYQFAGRISSSNSAGTASLTLPFPAGTAGTKLFIRAVATAPDGRPSPTFQLSGTAA
jgi:hypothetical protein